MNSFQKITRTPFLWAIKLYQKTLSLDHGPLAKLFPYGYCKFHPTCSQYGYEAIEHHGVVKGSAKTAWRIARCNPVSQGGFDPVVKESNPHE